MRSFFKPDSKLVDVMRAKPFTVSAEIVPPRNGLAQAEVFSQVRALAKAGADFFSVTKGAGGSLRGGSLPIAQAIKESLKVPCIAHFTCRDLLPAEVENQLMDHHYFGITNILGLRGDPPMGQSDASVSQGRDGAWRFAYQLIEQISGLNRGEFLTREGDAERKGPEASKPAAVEGGATEFCIGAAAYPEHPDFNEGVRFFARKVAAGAEYGITQMVFDADVWARFRDAVAREVGSPVPILPGVRIVKSSAQGLRMAERFGVSLPTAWRDELDRDGDRYLEPFCRFVERLRALGAPGVHLFVMSDTESAVAAFGRLRKG